MSQFQTYDSSETGFFPDIGKEAGIGGPSMDEKEQAKYKADLNRRAEKGGWKYRLFGRFLK